MRGPLVMVVLLSLVSAGSVARSRPTVKPFQLPLQEYRLKNGMRVVFSHDPKVPTVSVCMTYNVGSRVESRGHTGLAHLFEHLMFEGSKRYPRGALDRRIEGLGGYLNGGTSKDYTVYHETLPASKLSLGLSIEADRMQSLILNRKTLENQRSVVKEERRQTTDNQAYGKHQEALSATVYDGFAYKHPVVGEMADLDRFNLKDARRFYRTYYAPNNAVLTVVGNIPDARRALGMVKRYFGKIPARRSPPPTDFSEPRQTRERRRTIKDPKATVPLVDVAFKAPPGFSKDWYALGLLSDVLGNGRSSRLYRKLVTETGLAAAVQTSCQSSLGPSMFRVTAVPAPGKSPKEVERAICAEIGKVRKAPVSKAELQRACTLGFSDTASAYGSTNERAQQLGIFAAIHGDPKMICTAHLPYAEVTPKQVLEAASRFLSPSRRTVVTTVPAGSKKRGAR